MFCIFTKHLNLKALSKLSERKFQIYLAIGTTITPFIISAFIDKAKDIPITSTFIGWMKWIWTTIFEHQFKVWHILLAIVSLILLLVVIAALQSKSGQTRSKSWLNYIKDEFGGTEYRWEWTRPYGGKYHITNLRPICSCGTSMRINTNFDQRDMAICPRCNNRISASKSADDIEAVIIDNLNRNLYIDKI